MCAACARVCLAYVLYNKETTERAFALHVFPRAHKIPAHFFSRARSPPRAARPPGRPRPAGRGRARAHFHFQYDAHVACNVLVFIYLEPRYGQHTNTVVPHTKSWSSMVGAAVGRRRGSSRGALHVLLHTYSSKTTSAATVLACCAMALKTSSRSVKALN